MNCWLFSLAPLPLLLITTGGLCTKLGREDYYRTKLGIEDYYRTKLGREDYYRTKLGREDYYRTKLGREDYYCLTQDLNQLPLRSESAL